MVRKADMIDDENPEWTDKEFAAARPAKDVLPPELYAALTKRKPGQRGPGKHPPKVVVSFRIDREVVAHFKAIGGTRAMVETLSAKAPKRPKGVTEKSSKAEAKLPGEISSAGRWKSRPSASKKSPLRRA